MTLDEFKAFIAAEAAIHDQYGDCMASRFVQTRMAERLISIENKLDDLIRLVYSDDMH